MAPQRQLATPAYLVGFALICIPPFDALMQILPDRLSDPRWRFGAFGLMSNAMMIPLTGLLVVFLVAALFEHRLVQKVLGVLSLLLAIVIVGLFVVFALDALQVRPAVVPAASRAFWVATITASAKAMVGVLTLGAFAWAGLRGPRLSRPAVSARPNAMIIGSPTSVRASSAAPLATAPGPKEGPVVGPI